MGLDFKKPCRFTLSANEIRTFSECPRKRYYSSRDCLAIRANTPRTALMLGSAFHSSLEYYYTELNKLVNEHLSKGEVEESKILSYEYIEMLLECIPPFSIENFKGMGEGDIKTLQNIIFNYRDQLIKDLVEYEVVACEQQFYLESWPIDDVMYHGFIDMIVHKRSDDKIYFFEHKTCAGFRPEIYSRFDIQLHIYDFYGNKEYGDKFGGMILNQVKKSKTAKGYDAQRDLYQYDQNERDDFEQWIKLKTAALANPSNIHAPCNNYMSCKMCEYQDICMKFGYKIPKTHEEIIDDTAFEDEEGNKLFEWDPRESEEENKNEDNG